MLMIHLDKIKYWAVEKAIENPPDSASSFEGGECVAGFISVEKEDLPSLAKEAAFELSAHANRFGVKEVIIYPFAHLSSSLAEPQMAVEILELIKKHLEDMGFKVKRAPFGWYKGFSITCRGHPLCELSRTIESPRGPFYIKDSKVLSIDSAISSSLLPKELTSGNPWDNKVLGVMQKFGIFPDSISSIGKFIMDALLTWAMDRFSIDSVKIKHGGVTEVSGISGLTSFIRSCLDNGRYVKDDGIILYGSPSGSEVLLMPSIYKEDSIKEKLNEIMNGFSDHLLSMISSNKQGFNIPYDVDYGLDVYLYKTRNGGFSTIGSKGYVRDKEITCLGPMRNLIASLIDYGFKEAENGVTPYLPFWLSPYQVAVIPVKEQHEAYAKEITMNLVSSGVRVYYDPPGKSLGTRVRAAGKAWVPIIVVIGEKEVETNTVNVRRRWKQGSQEVLSIETFYEEVATLISESPFMKPINPPTS
ncbi:MAG: hypothetical protein F7B11_05545 [Caldisphaeraceae archaeon]|nr:hypothetical protein [Caldisphaeraceae archaeon]